ncbi:agamous-like MADS-box protein AGL14 [Diospyros lotus]|uniref:agamous-like MADS-box protein AGL14 n=1 Tax=Diospyros lotus TaxID=55363 RepID=UPI00224FADEB|nr:agamous-like MADS-box protein AGL14 [Diospyros lotus]
MVKRIENNKARKLTYKRRMAGIKKKAMELSTLCGIQASMVCFGPAGEIDTWPENPADVKTVIDMYQRRIDEPKLDDRLEAQKIKEAEEEISRARIENLEKIMKLMRAILDVFTQRAELLKETDGGREKIPLRIEGLVEILDQIKVDSIDKLDSYFEEAIASMKKFCEAVGNYYNEMIPSSSSQSVD